ncbi:hypothetical protein MTO96_039812 [Rhipicephalus appendiculatus]
MVLTKRRKRLLLLKKSPFDPKEPRGSTPAQVVGSTVVANPSRRERILHYVDSDYKFVIVDVGAYGKQSDGGVLEQSKFGRRLEEGKLHLPRDLALPNTSHSAPCVFVGDEAFQLRTDFLRPYPGRGLEGTERIFNYRLSRARWRILLRTMGEEPKQAEVVVKALCVLHNFLMPRRTGDEDSYCGPGFADSVDGFGQRQSGQWRENLVQPPMPVARTQARYFARAARRVRDLYAHYFSSAVGEVPWQDKIWCPVNTGPNAAQTAAQ